MTFKTRTPCLYCH